jgi:pimeloyl-ACP methyl ester carboxylesterase
MSFAVAAGLVAAAAGFAHAQNNDKDDISFKTFDGVLIKGSFYPSAKGSNAPVVMFLHKLGSDRTKGDWDALAVKLKAAGYAVLSFDFRGHGQSTTILEPEKFYQYGMNTSSYLYNFNTKKKVLKYSDFKPGYTVNLVNDIVAARYDLDNRNDSGQCNTSNIIVIGAEDGAALGLLWMSTEFARPAVYQKKNLFQLNPGNSASAAEDLAGAIWLSFSKSLHGPKGALGLPYGTLVSPSSPIAPTLRDRIPMWFAVGQNDKEGLNDANYLYDSVLKADVARAGKLDMTFKKPIATTNLRGAALLGKANLSTDDDIEKYIKKIVEKRPNAAPKKRNASETEPAEVPLPLFGFPNYPYP